MQFTTCQAAGLYLPCTQKFRHSPAGRSSNSAVTSHSVKRLHQRHDGMPSLESLALIEAIFMLPDQ
jgi:hypothetical protein